MTFAAPVLGSAIQPVVSLSRFSSCWDIALWRPRKGTLAPGSGSCTLSMTSWASSQKLRRAEELTANPTFRARLLFSCPSTHSRCVVWGFTFKAKPTRGHTNRSGSSVFTLDERPCRISFRRHHGENVQAV